MRISFTHVFDLTHRAVGMVGSLGLTAIELNLISPVGDFLTPYVPSWLLVILTIFCLHKKL